MDSWPLWGQWVVLLLVGGTFLGSSWWLALARARAAGVEPATWGERTRTVVGALRLADWAVPVLLVVFLVPLVVRTVAL
ncbi:hypothetical protein M3148_10465 [Georgenia satyanarayanai]|uniref:hypothetical protein n=1 Tax=Georgenia satyanarayanai TaxID=860221 RepID=UPI0020400600|nr:hypothetical protein [Georgenia satyanarayanai]MCM3661405.1 hypothetical protein [Georgenia satyanarayanai]